jgi:hypothetical protein
MSFLGGGHMMYPDEDQDWDQAYYDMDEAPWRVTI